MDILYLQKWLYKLAIIILIIGALNWLSVGVAGVNFVETLLGRSIARGIYIVVGIAALSIMFNRDTYLPFLGETVLPCGVIPESTPQGANTEMRVSDLPVGAKILYWAAEPETEGLKKTVDWRKAYLEFMNAGVTIVGQDGIAVLRVRKPQAYTVPWKGQIEPHIHFRICSADGMLARIKTVYVSDGRVEGFQDI
jgi:uncharacterized membrane protein YuzA (DUF378 family)